MISSTKVNREEAHLKIQLEAKNKCLEAGAEDQIELECEETYIPYESNKSSIVNYKAVGNIDLRKIAINNLGNNEFSPGPKRISEITIKTEGVERFEKRVVPEEEEITCTEFPTSPNLRVVGNRKEWILSELDVEWIALGASILGSGGGGSPSSEKIAIKDFIRNSGKEVRIVSPEDASDSEYAAFCAYFGAPSVMTECLGGSNKLSSAVKRIVSLQKQMGMDMHYLSPVEIGGLNSFAPFVIAGQLGIPVLDLDYMGRAFPRITMMTTIMNGQGVLPLCMVDDVGHEFVLFNIPDDDVEDVSSCGCLETFLRGSCERLGANTCVAGGCRRVGELKPYWVKFTISRCWKLGRGLDLARRNKINLTKTIFDYEHGKLIFRGKIIEYKMVVENAYNYGSIKIEGMACDDDDEGGNNFSGRFLEVRFQNENLIALSWAGDSSEKKVEVAVPDIITLIENSTYLPILTEELKFGLIVSVFAIPCDPCLETDACLDKVSPKAFGIDLERPPLGGFIRAEFVGNK
eukprot:TRINITY_DN11192_c0_g1_i2.p1 TRINITY_DN11192_c0_g1~~TRINITY_DN11192_c0_g1_i2.p1  ORF type:complete len:519 (-),score=126.11 TRINITY_DN11192_c0_g1_i2:74-1630(-)